MPRLRPRHGTTTGSSSLRTRCQLVPALPRAEVYDPRERAGSSPRRARENLTPRLRTSAFSQSDRGRFEAHTVEPTRPPGTAWPSGEVKCGDVRRKRCFALQRTLPVSVFICPIGSPAFLSYEIKECRTLPPARRSTIRVNVRFSCDRPASSDMIAAVAINRSLDSKGTTPSLTKPRNRFGLHVHSVRPPRSPGIEPRVFGTGHLWKPDSRIARMSGFESPDPR